MATKYQYGKDLRSDNKYKLDNYYGKYNQRICAQEYLNYKKMVDNEQYEIQMFNEEAFGTDDSAINTYKPDCKLETPTGSYWVEIKVQTKPLGEKIHLKQNQLDKLIDLEGYFLYSLKERFFIHSAKWLKQYSTLEHSNIFHKLCYIIQSDILDWKYWIHYPNYKDYYIENGYNTKKQKGKRQ
jgi:hypothetical protein